MANETICIPDLSQRPYGLAVEQVFPFPANVLFDGWTINFDKWFAAPGTLLMRVEVNEPFFFETVFKADDQETAQRHPHYGRFLKLDKNKFIQMTWVTGEIGTQGAETVVSIEFIEQGDQTLIKLSHSGFLNKQTMEGHNEAWPHVFEHMLNCLNDKSSGMTFTNTE